MRIIDTLHRWTGGLIGLLLAVMGTSGALLVNADTLFRPAAGHAGRALPLTGIVAEATHDGAHRLDYIIFASKQLPFHRVVYSDGAGQYLDADGTPAAHWRSMWERPELWLFDLHRYLFLGKPGETIVGVLATIGIAFIITGAFLWWQRRRSFAPRLLPARLTRPAILRHHRDLGIVVAPLLLLSFVTGAAMALKPVGLALVRPWSSAREIAAATAPPATAANTVAGAPDWSTMLADAKRRFPTAEIRLIAFPRKPGDLILIRMKQSQEWLPNGRTSLWYAQGDGHLVQARAALELPTGVTILDAFYAFHAAKVGGIVHRLIMTISGLGLMLLGSLSVWSFWFKRPNQPPNRRRGSD